MDIVGIGRQIELARKELHLTQVQLAELAGISYRPIYQIEDGRSIRLDTLIKLCDALGMNLEVAIRGGMIFQSRSYR